MYIQSGHLKLSWQGFEALSELESSDQTGISVLQGDKLYTTESVYLH